MSHLRNQNRCTARKESFLEKNVDWWVAFPILVLFGRLEPLISMLVVTTRILWLVWLRMENMALQLDLLSHLAKSHPSL